MIDGGGGMGGVGGGGGRGGRGANLGQFCLQPQLCQLAWLGEAEVRFQTT